jgi:hypothetical protein
MRVFDTAIVPHRYYGFSHNYLASDASKGVSQRSAINNSMNRVKETYEFYVE